jgi:hypothetical protein
MRTRSAIGALAAVIAAAVSLLSAAPAQSAPVWAPAATAAIHPGVMMYTDGAQCTANFIYTDSTSVYIGYAAHCAGLGAATDTDGCLAESLPLDTPVEVEGATRPGTLAYSSWVTMQQLGETDADTCAYNDLALVRLDPADVGRVNPSIPHWGGPVGINTTGIPAGQSVYSYGNSSLRLGITQLSPKSGISLGTSGGGWSHPVYTITPGIPGDSGSALLDASGRAAGVLSTVALAPLAGSNNFGDLSHELNYMRSHGGPQATLAAGTEAFNPNQLPLGV